MINKYLRQNMGSFFRPYLHVNNYIPELDILYVGISKTGISSVRSMLLDKLQVEYDKDRYNTIHRKANRLFRYIPIKQVCKMEDIFRFSIVRNPFDRLVSCYKNKILEENYYPIQKGYGSMFYKEMPFCEFVYVVSRIPDLLSDRHFRSQYSYLYYKGKLVVDYLARFENLEQDLFYVVSKCKLGCVPHINKAHVMSDYRDYYTKDLVEIVYGRYQADVHSFNYQKELQELRIHVEGGRHE